MMVHTARITSVPVTIQKAMGPSRAWRGASVRRDCVGHRGARALCGRLQSSWYCEGDRRSMHASPPLALSHFKAGRLIFRESGPGQENGAWSAQGDGRELSTTRDRASSLRRDENAEKSM